MLVKIVTFNVRQNVGNALRYLELKTCCHRSILKHTDTRGQILINKLIIIL